MAESVPVRSRFESLGAAALTLFGIAANHFKWPSSVFVGCFVAAGVLLLIAVFSLPAVAAVVQFRAPVHIGKVSVKRPQALPQPVLDLIEQQRLGEQLLERLPKHTGMYVNAEPKLKAELRMWTARVESLLEPWPRDKRSFAGQVSVQRNSEDAEAPETQELKARLAILGRITDNLKPSE
jgi:hypothetical protein